MNEISAINSSQQIPILGITPKVFSATDTLCRVVKLSNALSKDDSCKTKLKTLQDTLSQVHQELFSHDIAETKATLKHALSTAEFGLTKEKISGIYEEMIEAATTAETLNKCIRKFMKDIASISTFDIRETTRGANGPTHIVSLSRFSSKLAIAKRRDYVIKWTRWNEVCSSRLYETLSQKLLLKDQTPSFFVPKTAALDFDRKIHDMCDGGNCPLETETALYLKKSFLEVAGKSKRPLDSLIMLIEKINGSNFLDFVRTKYDSLDLNQKLDLFENMGQLATLDLLIGNTDRLIKLHLKGQHYAVNPLASANFGNIMISWNPENGMWPKLHAIDNGVDLQLISNEKHKTAYKQFLEECFASLMAVESLTTHLLKSMEDAIKIQKEPNRSIQCFLADLDNPDLAKNALTKGLSEMFEALEKSLPSIWNSDQTLEVKKHLKENLPPLLEAISERFEIFNKRI